MKVNYFILLLILVVAIFFRLFPLISPEVNYEPFVYASSNFIISYGLEIPVKIALTALGMIVVFIFARELAGIKTGYIASFFYAISQIGIVTTQFSLWDGEAIVPIIGIFSYLCLLYYFKERNPDYMVLSLISIIFCWLYWNGGVFFVATYIMILAVLIKPRVIYAIPFVVFAGYLALHLVTSATFNGSSFIPLPTTSMEVLYPYVYPVTLSGILLYLFSNTIIFLIPLVFLLFFYKPQNKWQQQVFLAILVMIIAAMPFLLSNPLWWCLYYLPMVILAGVGFDILVDYKRRNIRHPVLAHSLNIIGSVAIAVYIIEILLNVFIIGSSSTSIQSQLPSYLSSHSALTNAVYAFYYSTNWVFIPATIVLFLLYIIAAFRSASNRVYFNL